MPDTRPNILFLLSDQHRFDFLGTNQALPVRTPNIDRQVGRLVDTLAERGELENTVIVYSSDHGEMLGDHNRWRKQTYYHPSLGVPLVVAGPDIVEGMVNETPVALHDLAATFLEFGAAGTLPDQEAVSLRPLLAGKTQRIRDYAFAGLKNWRLVFDGRYKLIVTQRPSAQQDGKSLAQLLQPGGGVIEDSGVQLFDLAADPLENVNFAAQAPGEVERLRRALEAHLASGGTARALY